MLIYPAVVIKDTNDTYLVTMPDIPEAAAVGDTEEEALRDAIDSIETAFDFYFGQRRAVPEPGKPAKGQPVVIVPALITAKVLLHNEMMAQGVRKAELARRLSIAAPSVERIFDLRHNTKIETIEAALATLGKRLDVRVV